LEKTLERQGEGQSQENKFPASIKKEEPGIGKGNDKRRSRNTITKLWPTWETHGHTIRDKRKGEKASIKNGVEKGQPMSYGR